MQNLIRKIVLVISLVLNLNLLISSGEQINQNQTIEIATIPTPKHIRQGSSGSVLLPPTVPISPPASTKPESQDSGKSTTFPFNGSDTAKLNSDAIETDKRKTKSIQSLTKPIPPHKKVPLIEPPSAPDNSPMIQRSNTHTPYMMARKIMNTQEMDGLDRSESYSVREYPAGKRPSMTHGDSPGMIYKRTLPIAGYKFPSRRGSRALSIGAGDWFPSTPNISHPIITSPRAIHKKTIAAPELAYRSRVGSTSSRFGSNRPSNPQSARTNKSTLQADDYTLDDDYEEQGELYGINLSREVRKSSLLNNYTSTLADVTPEDRREILSKFINSLPLLQHLENMIQDAEEAALRLEDLESEESHPSGPTTHDGSTPQGASTTFRSAQPSQVNQGRTLSREKTKEIYTTCLNALIEGAVSNPIVHNVLSIDGGGIRGIVACIILDKIESSTGRRVQELFNVFTGTSIGGIIAIGLLLRDSQGNFLYHPYELYKILTNNANKIFSRSCCACLSRAFKSKYDNKNLKLLITALVQGKNTGKRTRAELAKAGIQTTFKQYSQPRTSISSSSSYSSGGGVCCLHRAATQGTPHSETSSENSHIGDIEDDILLKENVITSLWDVSNPPISLESRCNPTGSARSLRGKYKVVGDEEIRSQFNLDETGYQPGYLSDQDDPQRRTKSRATGSKMRLIVPAYDIHGLNTVIFDSEAEKNYSLVDVALSTSAAPTYFPSHPTHEVNREDNSLNNVDGGLFSNFPAPAAISRLIGRKHRLKPKLNVVSASTGSAPKASEDNLEKDRGRFLWLAHGLFSIIRRSPTQFAEDTLSNCADTYIRFRVPLRQASSSMDDATEKNIMSLVADTARYCRDNANLFMDVKKNIRPLEIIDARNVEPETYALPETIISQHVLGTSRVNSYTGFLNNSTTALCNASTPRTEDYDDDEDEPVDLSEDLQYIDDELFRGPARDRGTSNCTLDERESDYYDDEIQIAPANKPHSTK